MNVLCKINNFFRKTSDEVVGIYFNGEKIFLAHYTNKFELEEINFEIDFTEKISPTEQLAEKISMILNQRGWQKSKIGLCLNDDDAIILKTSFDNVPENEIDSAVKTWAITKSDINAAYSFQKIDEIIWAETLSDTLVENYISAYKKNFLNLCALSVMPTPADDSDKSVFIAEIILHKKPPNLIKNIPVEYDYKKIFLAIAGIFLFTAIFFSLKLVFDYHFAKNNLHAVNKFILPKKNSLAIKFKCDNFAREIVFICKFADSHLNKFAKLNSFMQLGNISDDFANIQKILANKISVKISGVADKMDSVDKILRRLDNSILENSANIDGGINFSIKIF